jgi:hypothetical protein
MRNSKIIQQVDLLTKLTFSLAQTLTKQPWQKTNADGHHQHLAHQLPTTLKSDEKTSPDFIPIIETYQDEEALSMAGQYFGKFKAKEDSTLSTRFTDRLPGVIHVTQYQSQVLQLITDINALKDEIKEHVKTVPEKERFSYIHDAIPGLMTLQVYRHILFKEVNDLPLRTISLTWARRPTTDKLTKEGALSLVSSSLDFKTNTFLFDRSLTETIKNADTDIFKRRRYSRPLPICQLQIKNEPAFQANCYLPLLLIGEPSTPFKIKPLKDFVLKPLNNRKKTTKEILLSERLNIFAIYPNSQE